MMTIVKTHSKKGAVLGSPAERFMRAMFTEIIAALARTLNEGDFSVAQIAVLHLIDGRGPNRANVLAKTLSLSTSAMSRLIDDLVKRGFLSRIEDPTDRRAHVLSVTPMAARFLDAISETRVATAYQAAEAMDERMATMLRTSIEGFSKRRGSK